MTDRLLTMEEAIRVAAEEVTRMAYTAGVAAERERAARIARMHRDRAFNCGQYGIAQKIDGLVDDILVPKRAHGDVRPINDNPPNDTKEEHDGEDDAGPGRAMAEGSEQGRGARAEDDAGRGRSEADD